MQYTPKISIVILFIYLYSPLKHFLVEQGMLSSICLGPICNQARFKASVSRSTFARECCLGDTIP